MAGWRLALAGSVLAGVLAWAGPAWAATRVMILPFEAPKTSPEIETLGPGTMDSLITALKQIPDFIVLDRVTIAQAIKEQAFQQSGLVDPQSAQKLGKILGAQVMITGRVQVVGTKVRLTGTFVDVATGEAKEAETVTGELSQVFDLQDQLALAFVHRQGVTMTADQSQTMTQVFQSTDNLSAYDSYQRGREAYMLFSPAGYQTASDWYKKALAADPKYALALTGLAETMALWAHNREQMGESPAAMLDEARWTAQRALDLNPKLPEANRAMAVVLVRRGDATARIFAQQAVATAPNDAESWWALWLTGNRDPDGPELKKALELNPRLLTAIVDRGAILQARGQYDDAIYEFRTALRINPDDSEAHNNLAIALKAKGRLDEATEEYREAIRLNPANPLYHYNLAIALKVKGDGNGAITAYRAALQANPRLASAHTGLGVALREQGKIPEAIESYRTALRLNPKDSIAMFNLAMTLRTAGQAAEATSLFSQFVELWPTGAASEEAKRQLAELKAGKR